MRESTETTRLDRSLRDPVERGEQHLEDSEAIPSLSGKVTHRTTFGAFMLAVFGLSVFPVFLGLLNHDDTWLLYAANRVLAGDTLYVDVVETNPPLIVWLNFLPVLLARAVGIWDAIALRLIVLGLIATSLFLTQWTLCRALPDRIASRRLLLVLSLFILLPLTGYVYGEREHLLLALVLPYLVMASGLAMDRPMEGVVPWLVGIMAGLGILLKPHFVPLWIAIEVYIVCVRGDWRVWLRPEALIVVALGLIYPIAIVVITPQYLTMVKWAGSLYLVSRQVSPAFLISEPEALFSMMAWLGFLLVRPRGDLRRCCELMLVANICVLSAVLIQYKGYRYHYYPPIASAMLLLGLACGGLLAILAGQAVADRVNETRMWREYLDSPDSQLGRMVRLAKEHAKGGSIYTFSPALVNGFPLVTYSRVGWASRHPCLWFLPALYAEDFDKSAIVYHPIEAMSNTERSLFESVVDDLLKHQPLLLFVDAAEPKWVFNRKDFDFLDYYSQDPRFAAFLRQYELISRVNSFQVYRRKPSTQVTTRL
jgi:hypothetical protein